MRKGKVSKLRCDESKAVQYESSEVWPATWRAQEKKTNANVDDGGARCMVPAPSMSTLLKIRSQCCMILQGTLGGNFDIFAASGESTAWVLLWKIPFKTQFISSTPHRMCASGHTNYPSPPHYTFFDDPDVPFEPSGLPAPPEPLQPPRSPGPPPRWRPAPSPAGGREEWKQETYCVSDCTRDLHRSSLNLFRYH